MDMGSWNRVLEKYAPKMEELIVRWRKLDNEFHGLCSSRCHNGIKKENMIHKGEKRKAYKVMAKRREEIF
jgi:hypothetical protein